MGHVPLLDELAVIAALGVLVTVILSRLKLPTVAGLLAAGALLGPFGLRLTRSVHSIEVLAEVGVVLLLFSIGLEFSLERLKNIFKQVALGGALQVVGTTVVIAAVARALGQPAGRSIFYGFVFALSSTAIVLRALTERRELDAPHGRFIVGTLIFQDLCVVPMVLVVPYLGRAASAGVIAKELGLALGKASLVVVATIVIARVVVPRALKWVDASRSREVFLLAILGICIGTAWVTSLVGLSLALGAFLGGMVVADTEYGHRAMGDILPLRDAFVSIFFVSLGMLFDVRVVIAHPVIVLSLLLGFLVAKGVIATLAAAVMRFPPRAAWLAGVGLAQFGEFGFVLTRLAKQSNVIDEHSTAPLLAAGIISMFVTPLLVRAAPHIRAGERLLAPLERLLGVRSIDDADQETEVLRDHVVIVGFGLAGRYAAESLRQCGRDFVVLELNAENVRKGRELDLPVYYGDATSEEALRHAHIEHASLVVLLMNDPPAALRIVDTLRRVSPATPVLMRTKYLSEREILVSLGAHDVVAEEVEGAVEVISRMLRRIEIPRNVIDDRVHEVRAETQPSDRRLSIPPTKMMSVPALAEMRIETALVQKGSKAVGQSPVTLRLRSETGALVVGVSRAKKLIDRMDSTSVFEEGDVVYFVGTGDALRNALPYFNTGAVLRTSAVKEQGA
jgi:CPA2 family monovalent cation:H+ antiporter-2